MEALGKALPGARISHTDLLRRLVESIPLLGLGLLLFGEAMVEGEELEEEHDGGVHEVVLPFPFF